MELPRSKLEVVDWLSKNWGAPDLSVISNKLPINVSIQNGNGFTKSGLKEKVETILENKIKKEADFETEGMIWKE